MTQITELAVFFLSLILTARSLVITLRAKRLRKWDELRNEFNDALERLKDAPSSERIESYLAASLSAYGARPSAPLDTWTMISAIATYGDRDQFTEVFEEVRQWVNFLNPICDRFDHGFIEPKSFFRWALEAHFTLMTRLPIVTPFIWYVVVFHRRGRWGLRVIRLLDIAKQVRPLSSSERVRRSYDVRVGQFVIASYRECTRWDWMMYSLLFAIRSPSFSTRSKIRQRRLLDRYHADAVCLVDVKAPKARQW